MLQNFTVDENQELERPARNMRSWQELCLAAINGTGNGDLANTGDNVEAAYAEAMRTHQLPRVRTFSSITQAVKQVYAQRAAANTPATGGGDNDDGGDDGSARKRPRVEDAAAPASDGTGDSTHVLVTGSLHLVGGVLRVTNWRWPS